MLKSIPLYIALRYTRAKKRNHFISFISLSSVLGIALGVMVLITVLSVMNGFDEQIQKRFFAMAPEVTVTDYQGGISQWPSLAKSLSTHKEVLSVAPYVGGQAMIKRYNRVKPFLLTGILPTAESSVSSLQSKMIHGALNQLKPGDYGIVLGKGIAQHLGVMLDDKVTVMIPQLSVSPVGVNPRLRQFTVVGVFSAGNGFGFDSQLAFIHLQDAQRLYQLGDKVTGLHLKVNDIYAAPQIAKDLGHGIAKDYLVGSWSDQYGAFFKAVKMEKTIMFCILILIIAVAAFNLVSSLVMVVTDKQADIAILRTLGATPASILKIFIWQGILLAVFGILLGTVGGIYLSWHATGIVDWVQLRLGIDLMSSNAYIVNYLPSKLEYMDVLHTALIALLLGFVATIYPAWRASCVQPAEALRYE